MGSDKSGYFRFVTPSRSFQQKIMFTFLSFYNFRRIYRQYVTTNILFQVTDDSCLDSVSLFINNNFISAIKLM